MKADCSVCSLTWNVSNTEEVKQRISEGKYICPYCISKRRKRAHRRWQSPSRPVTKNNYRTSIKQNRR